MYYIKQSFRRLWRSDSRVPEIERADFETKPDVPRQYTDPPATGECSFGSAENNGDRPAYSCAAAEEFSLRENRRAPRRPRFAGGSGPDYSHSAAKQS